MAVLISSCINVVHAAKHEFQPGGVGGHTPSRTARLEIWAAATAGRVAFFSSCCPHLRGSRLKNTVTSHKVELVELLERLHSKALMLRFSFVQELPELDNSGRTRAFQRVLLNTCQEEFEGAETARQVQSCFCKSCFFCQHLISVSCGADGLDRFGGWSIFLQIGQRVGSGSAFGLCMSWLDLRLRCSCWAQSAQSSAFLI